MLTLCVDTAYKYLGCALIQDSTILASESFPCFKSQSEQLFVVLKQVFSMANVDPKEIDSICISKGPGSYTGTRIAMTLAKVIGQTLPCNVFTISTLKLYAAGEPKTMVIMNARANRAYVGVYDNNETIIADHIEEISSINTMSYNIVGDGLLVNKVDNYPDIGQAFLNTKPVWEKVDNIAFLVPEYLKESESYFND